MGRQYRPCLGRDDGQAIATFEGHTDHVTSVSFSRDGRTLAAGSNDKTVRVWDLETGQTLQTLKGHSRQITCVQFSPEGATLASASIDGTIRLWDAASGNLLCTLPGTHALRR